MSASTSEQNKPRNGTAAAKSASVDADARADETRGEPGLPWPEAYADLESLVREQWQIEGQIYLNRLLGGGRSGALVYAADVTSASFTGQAILKLDRNWDATSVERLEADRHQQAYGAEPEFAERHLPRIVGTLHHEDHYAILSTIAGRGLEYAAPWSACSFDSQLSVARRVSSGLLEGWNKDYQLVEGMLEPQELIEAWLGHRLDPKRMNRFLAEQYDLTEDQPGFIQEGRWLPNPLAFLHRTQELPGSARLRAVKGNHHGDLNTLNILVSSQPSKRTRYFLIDLAHYEREQFLMFDQAYLEIAYLLEVRGSADWSRWNSILERVGSKDGGSESDLAADDLGLIQMISALRREVRTWIDRNEPNRLSYFESQQLLARVAAGLTFVSRHSLGIRGRGLALGYAATNLSDYLRLQRIEWPKSGPTIALTAPNQSAEASRLADDAHVPVLEKPRASGVGARSDLATPAKPGVAVLPFDNLSDDPEQEYFAEAVAEDLITELSRIDWLLVSSRNASFTYKGQTADPKRIGRELGVRYVVEGSVRRLGSRARIWVQLNEAEVAGHIWAERYDLDLTVQNLFALEEEIAKVVVGHLDSTMRNTERDLARRKPPDSLNVWELYQRAHWHFFKFTHEDDKLSEMLAKRAIEEAPEFAPPYALLANLAIRAAYLGGSARPGRRVKQAMKYATKAVALDEGDSLGYVALGRSYTLSGRHDLALVQLEKAIALSPSAANAHLAKAESLAFSGNAEEALAVLETVSHLDPKDPMVVLREVCRSACYYLLGDPVQAEASARLAIGVRPSAMFGHLMLAVALAEQDRIPEAKAAFREMRSGLPAFSVIRFVRLVRRMDSRYRALFFRDLRKILLS
ncbi:MAG: tetratricopeptide repeat protein [Pseudomonadota bacterium]